MAPARPCLVVVVVCSHTLALLALLGSCPFPFLSRAAQAQEAQNAGVCC